jgi:hypothetical protein
MQRGVRRMLRSRSSYLYRQNAADEGRETTTTWDDVPTPREVKPVITGNRPSPDAVEGRREDKTPELSNAIGCRWGRMRGTTEFVVQNFVKSRVWWRFPRLLLPTSKLLFECPIMYFKRGMKVVRTMERGKRGKGG